MVSYKNKISYEEWIPNSFIRPGQSFYQNLNLDFDEEKTGDRKDGVFVIIRYLHEDDQHESNPQSYGVTIGRKISSDEEKYIKFQ